MPLPPAVRSALLVNLLTEDNLPHYFVQLVTHFGEAEVWREWNNRWTAEEGRHSIVIRDYLTVTRSIDLRQLERARMVQVSRGIVPDPPTIADGIVYVALQEIATRVAHRNTGKLLDDPFGEAIMSRVAADENFHHLYYRDLTSAALEIDPSTMVAAIERQVRHFEMPGAGIPDFNTRARAIADVGVYDFQSHHDQVLVPVIMKHWRIEHLQNLKSAAEQARERLIHHMERINLAAQRMLARRARRPRPRSSHLALVRTIALVDHTKTRTSSAAGTRSDRRGVDDSGRARLRAAWGVMPTRFTVGGRGDKIHFFDSAHQATDYGWHIVDGNGEPYAAHVRGTSIANGSGWTTGTDPISATASHEALEMLGDPGRQRVLLRRRRAPLVAARCAIPSRKTPTGSWPGA